MPDPDGKLVDGLERVREVVDELGRAYDEWADGVMRAGAACTAMAKWEPPADMDAKLAGLMAARKGKHACMVRLHYLAGRTWQETADVLGYEVSLMYKEREAALLDFYDFMPHEFRMPRVPAL